ncbi:protein O-GlcNAcase-like isoform X2 [Watersipora subatra]|uniref:protein O-GlcNAcase-like isoform X2 n=1 Tax=Watersipora subatra TaxID=2589382 RepID=UPI00355BF123
MLKNLKSKIFGKKNVSSQGDMPSSAASDDSDYDSDRNYDVARPSDKPFICGVVEGFYGRPWNTYQRVELFYRMKKFGMNTYLYAPKDDVKHRAYWRDLYTVEEAESLTELIQSANEHGLKFVYAISPGLDITYSSNKDLTILRRKLDQVSSFGCQAFALLFDDILPEMNKSDKEVFASFAHAQSSVTNQIYEHLKQPSFMFCPTEYCSTRSVPTVQNSPYLNTIGEKLIQGIEIMWTGPKVVSKNISVHSIKELNRVLRRPALIWDNIHANDYDQKRIYLGPFSGRSPALIPHLAGVLTNPNCEFEPNYVALHTLATWSRSISAPDKRKVEAETDVEREGLEEASSMVTGYEPRLIHRLAIKEWLPTFYVSTQPDGGRPPPPKLALAPTDVTPVVDAINSPILNNIPTSVMTCMAVTPITQTAPVGLAVPVDQLVGEVKVHPEQEAAQEEAGCEPMDVITDKPCIAAEEPAVKELLPNSLVRRSGSTTSLEDVMQVDEEITNSATKITDDNKLTVDDLEMICDMFYLPFEHGPKALHTLTEFQWLNSNSHVVNQLKKHNAEEQTLIEEWQRRAAEFNKFVKYFAEVCEKFQMIPNRCLMYDMNNYLWDLRGTLSLLNSYIKWLGSSQGYTEAFMSGDNEPWVFRGGLTGELQRLLPIDGATDLLSHTHNLADPVMRLKPTVYTIRPFLPADEASVYDVCKQVNSKMYDTKELVDHEQLIPDLMVGGLITLNSQYCFIVEGDHGICGYVVAAPNAGEFHTKMALSWLPEMQKKYPMPVETENAMPTLMQELSSQFHNYQPERSESLLSQFPALLKIEFLPSVDDHSIKQKTLACIFSALKSTRVHGVHSVIDEKSVYSQSMYRMLGFGIADSSTLTTLAYNQSTVFIRNI